MSTTATPGLARVERLLGDHPTHSIIWLHGLGADGHDFEPFVEELKLPPGLSARFVFPHAPVRPITINNGFAMRAWYDILDFSDLHRTVDEAGILESAAQIRELIQHEIDRGIPSEHLVLGGFSQGGVLAYHVGLTLDVPLAGIVALSTYLPHIGMLSGMRHAANAKTPVFAGHGTADPVVNFTLGDTARRQVENWGYPLTWNTYPMPHSVCWEEIVDLSAWLGNVMRKPV